MRPRPLGALLAALLAASYCGAQVSAAGRSPYRQLQGCGAARSRPRCQPARAVTVFLSFQTP